MSRPLSKKKLKAMQEETESMSQQYGEMSDEEIFAEQSRLIGAIDDLDRKKKDFNGGIKSTKASLQKNLTFLTRTLRERREVAKAEKKKEENL